MFEIENSIMEILNGEARKNALNFAAYLRANGMLFERGKGYWADKHYYMIKYNGEYVCFILINGGEDNTEPEGWVVWSDDSGADWFACATPDEHLKETAWKNIDVCANCGGCKHPGGRRRTIFGKAFDNVCLTAMSFNNPNARTLEYVKKIIELRKSAILGNI